MKLRWIYSNRICTIRSIANIQTILWKKCVLALFFQNWDQAKDVSSCIQLRLSCDVTRVRNLNLSSSSQIQFLNRHSFEISLTFLYPWITHNIHVLHPLYLVTFSKSTDQLFFSHFFFHGVLILYSLIQTMSNVSQSQFKAYSPTDVSRSYQ